MYVFRDVWYVVAGVLRAHQKEILHCGMGEERLSVRVLFSGMVELLQEYCTTYRGGDWLDFAANTTGADCFADRIFCITSANGKRNNNGD